MKRKSARQWSDEELADIAESEDLLDMIEQIYTPEEIADPETRQLWTEARETIRAIRDRLNRAWVHKD